MGGVTSQVGPERGDGLCLGRMGRKGRRALLTNRDLACGRGGGGGGGGSWGRGGETHGALCGLYLDTLGGSGGNFRGSLQSGVMSDWVGVSEREGVQARMSD